MNQDKSCVEFFTLKKLMVSLWESIGSLSLRPTLRTLSMESEFLSLASQTSCLKLNFRRQEQLYPCVTHSQHQLALSFNSRIQLVAIQLILIQLRIATIVQQIALVELQLTVALVLLQLAMVVQVISHRLVQEPRLQTL